MGNRAFIAPKGARVGVYLHWNGGRDSVEAFLKYAELAHLPGLGEDRSDPTGLGGLPSFLTVITNFFGNDGMNAYLGECNPFDLCQSDPGDNGVYVVSGHEIIERIGGGFEQRHHGMLEMLKAIDEKQPEASQLGGFLDAEEVPTDKLEAGDQVYLLNRWNKGAGRYKLYTVLGRGDESTGYVNGTMTDGVPYVDMFDNQDNSQNCNAYIRTETVRVAR